MSKALRRRDFGSEKKSLTTRENLRQEENRYRYIKQRIFSHEKFQKDFCVYIFHAGVNNTWCVQQLTSGRAKDYVGWACMGKKCRH